jgi:NADPH-dependent curcumin reductase CurA
MQHIVEKFLTRAITLLQTSIQSKVSTKSFGFPKSQESQFRVKTPDLGVPRQNDIWVQLSWLGIENTIRAKVVACPKFRP